jgi:hypothetical protein
MLPWHAEHVEAGRWRHAMFVLDGSILVLRPGTSILQWSSLTQWSTRRHRSRMPCHRPRRQPCPRFSSYVFKAVHPNCRHATAGAVAEWIIGPTSKAHSDPERANVRVYGSRRSFWLSVIRQALAVFTGERDVDVHEGSGFRPIPTRRRSQCVDRVRMSRRVERRRGTSAGRERSGSASRHRTGPLTCAFPGSPNGVRTRVSTLRG